MSLAWIYLLIAGLLEVVWVAAMKFSNGFTVLVPSVITAFAAAGSFYMLGLAIKELPLGTAYAIWVGIGAIGAAFLGIIWFGDPATTLRIAGIALIAAGILALKLA